jgi:hypothetical protein
VIKQHKREEKALSEILGISLQSEIADALPESAVANVLLDRAEQVADPNRNRKNDALLIRVFAWLRMEKAAGGVLGAAISFGDVPIFAPREIESFSGSDDELRRDHPPVVVHWDGDKADLIKSAESLGALHVAQILSSPGRMVRRGSMPDDVRAAFDGLARALFDVEGLPSSVGREREQVRGAYRAFAAPFHHWADGVGALLGDDSPQSLSGLLPKQTFGPIARMEQAFADYNRFKRNRNGTALVHQHRDAKGRMDPIEVVLAPVESSQWFAPATVDELQAKLCAIGSPLSFTFAVAISLAVENQRVDLDLDEFIRFLGLDPRSTEQRLAQRRTLWECLKIFSQTSAVGELRGNYRDKNGKPIDYIENHPAIAITGTRYPKEMLLDKSETPIRVGFVAGDFLNRHRANRKLLASLGDLRQLAGIPSGKAGGRWARTIGLALLQYWREKSATAQIGRVGEDSHQTVQFNAHQPLTRRHLFTCMRPDPDPFELLKGNTPARAREYWDQAIAILREQKTIWVAPSAPMELPRKAWADAWLDEPLDVRPHRDDLATIEAIKSISDGAKTWKKKRGRPRKKPAN